ncbi:helix-turn-helix domain-containing protein [Streptomyces sp. NPDC059853]|uniref:helix-turn-helix domain-containing protein n=1 Tax=Streptomyces sp. NPDC059853 TaxID=3346973 RepID=UPI0036528971
MPPRERPTARQARLGAELRKLREQAGRTARETAAMLGTDQGKISHIESGRIGVSEERIRRLAAYYGCTDTPLLEALSAIAREHRGQYWWDSYRGVLPPRFLDLAELEHHSTRMRILHTVNVPGLLQTEEYIRAVNGMRPPGEVEPYVEYRLRRQTVLERTDPAPFDVVLHEAALRMRFGGRRVVRTQLEHLMKASERPHITLRVIPFTNERFYEATQPLLYAHGVVRQLDTVQMDTPIGGLLLTADDQLREYRDFFDDAHDFTLSPAESRGLIHHIAREL